MPEPTNPPIGVDAVAEALHAADPPLPDTDEVAHYYECLGEAEAAMPVVRAVWPLAVAEGRRQGRRAAAADIRAEIITGAQGWAQPGSKPKASDLREWAARIAEGVENA